jgi:hypothetical protein
MVTTLDDLDLTQAKAFALEPHELDELLGTLDASLTTSLQQLRMPTSEDDFLRGLHDLKGYLGLVASPELCAQMQALYAQARASTPATACPLPASLVSRLEVLQQRLSAYRAGIIQP